MAFNTKEQELIRFGIQQGKPRAEIEQALIKLRTGYVPQQPTTQPSKEPGFLERAGAEINTAGARVNQAITGQGEFEGRTAVRRGVEAAGEAAGGVLNVASQALPSPVRTGLEKVGEAAGSVINFLGEKIGNVPAIQSWVQNNPEAAKALEEVAGTAAGLGRVSGTILAAQGAATGLQKTANAAQAGAQKVSQAASNALDAARPATKALYDRSSQLIKPQPTPQKALGEVLQSKKPVGPREMEALKQVDTTNVKSFADLESKVNESIGKLSGQVDDYLGQDRTPIPMNRLVTKTTSGSGKVIERNFVQTALDHLKELYAKTADDIGAADVDDLISKANTNGLTRLEVNDISRLYNGEFGSKAFSKMGDPLTSVNAQAYENIRSGLKGVARQGMGGAEAAATDKVISSLYNVKTLVTKNREAAQRLQQKIAERGLLEKVGHAVAKYGDIATGGSIRGFVGGLLPRGAGYKVMNALDLEQRLSNNLKIIKKALESGDDAALINAAKQLEAATPATPALAPKSSSSGNGSTLMDKAKGVFNKIKTDGKRGFIALPGKGKIPEPRDVAKNMDARDLKIVRNYLDAVDGKAPGAQSFIDTSTKFDDLLKSIGVTAKLSDEAKADYAATLRDFIEDPIQGRDKLGRFATK